MEATTREERHHEAHGGGGIRRRRARAGRRAEPAPPRRLVIFCTIDIPVCCIINFRLLHSASQMVVTVASEFCPLNSHEAGLRIMKKPETGTINSLNLLVALPIMQIMFVRRRQQQGLCLRSTKSRTIFMTCKGSQNHSTSCQRQVSHNPAIISTSLEHLT
jgi:hypothetical protein